MNSPQTQSLPMPLMERTDPPLSDSLTPTPFEKALIAVAIRDADTLTFDWQNLDQLCERTMR